MKYESNGVTFTSTNFAKGNMILFETIGSPKNKSLNIISNTLAFLNYTDDILNVVDKFKPCDQSNIDSCKYTSSMPWNPFYIDSLNSVPTQGGVITVKGKSLKSIPAGSNQLIFNQESNINEDSTKADGTEIYFTLNSTIAQLASGKNIPNYFIVRGDGTFANPISIYNSPTFSFLPPTISKVEYSMDENKITVVGENFGFFENQITLTNGTSDSSYKYLPKLTVQHTTIVADIDPNGYSYSGPYLYVLSVGTQPNANSVSYTTSLNPIVTSVSSTPSSGGKVTIKGQRLNLFRRNDTIATVVITIGNNPCSILTATDNNLFVCELQTIPAGTPNFNLTVTVSIDGYLSNTDVMFSADLPNVNSDIQEGGNIILLGSDFENDTSAIVLYFNGTTQIHPISVTPTTVTFKLPPSTPSGVYSNNKLTKHNTSPTPAFDITIHPYITYVTSPPTQGGNITISGQYMMSSLGGSNTNSSKVNETIEVYIYNDGRGMVGSCLQPKRINATAITCIAPIGSGRNNNIAFSLNGLNATTDDNFNVMYQGPTILAATSVSPFGGDVTIIGKSLGYQGIGNDLLQITISNNRKCIPVGALNSSAIVCTLKTGQFNLPPPENYLNLSVTVDSLTSSNSTVFKLDNTEYYRILNKIKDTNYSQLEYDENKLYGIVFPAALLAPIILWSTFKLLYHQISYMK